MGLSSDGHTETARAALLAALDAAREELVAVVQAADDVVRTGDPGPLARLDLARLATARDTLAEAGRAHP